jgi:hypothetical protein
LDELALSGTWTVGPESATAGAGASLELSFQASDVYLVLGGTGRIDISVEQAPTRSLEVAGIPRLYTLLHDASYHAAVLRIDVSPGVDAYDFTFG